MTLSLTLKSNYNETSSMIRLCLAQILKPPRELAAVTTLLWQYQTKSRLIELIKAKLQVIAATG